MDSHARINGFLHLEIVGKDREWRSAKPMDLHSSEEWLKECFNVDETVAEEPSFYSEVQDLVGKLGNQSKIGSKGLTSLVQRNQIIQPQHLMEITMTTKEGHMHMLNQIKAIAQLKDPKYERPLRIIDDPIDETDKKSEEETLDALETISGSQYVSNMDVDSSG